MVKKSAVIKSKKTIWLLCSLPLWVDLFYAFWICPATFPYWSKSLAITGYSAAVLLAISLSLAPLSHHIPIPFFKALNRHKREVGLAAFFYAVIHVSSYFMKKWLKDGALPWKYLLHPMIIPGEAALLILAILALTSTHYAQKVMGWERWKRLHRSIYFAEGFVFLHMFLQRGSTVVWGFVIFTTLFLIQRLRFRSSK